MRNSTRAFFAIGFSLIALGTFKSAAEAATNMLVHFNGSRDQVRSACSSGGGEVTEGSNYTSCTNVNGNGNSVTCDDKGKCNGTYTAAVVGTGGRPAKLRTGIQAVLGQ